MFVMVLMAFCPSGLLGLAERFRKPAAARPPESNQ
jgi:hypothetical protein